MKLHVHIDYPDLLSVIKQLPPDLFLKLKGEMDDLLSEKTRKDSSNKLKELLMNAPVMTDQEYQQFEENRKMFDNWRTT